LLLATVAAVILWFLVLLGVAFATRARGVDPGLAAMDLGEEPPAVVDLLTSDWRVTPDAVPATLLDLAARDYVDLEQHGPGRTVCRLRRTSAEGLEAYERMVLDHVVGLAVDGVVPAEALTTGPQDQSTRWWRAFRQAVVADARERGLARDRWSGPVKAFLRAAALVPAGLGVLYANAAGGLDFGTIGAGLVIWVVLTSSIRLFGDQRDTPAGAEAAARWLGVRDYLGRNEVFPTLPPASVAIWDRYLGYGAALGVATAALRALPMGAEDDHRAWSAYGGRWRVVKVRYPRLGFTWGRRPPVAFLVGLATAGAGYVALRLMLGVRAWTEGQLDIDQAAGWMRTAATVLAVAVLLVAAWGAWTMLRAVLDLVSRREVEGQVVRRRSYSRGNDRTDHFIAVDSGRSDRIKAGWSRAVSTPASGKAEWSGRPSVPGCGTSSGSSPSARPGRRLESPARAPRTPRSSWRRAGTRRSSWRRVGMRRSSWRRVGMRRSSWRRAGRLRRSRHRAGVAGPRTRRRWRGWPARPACSPTRGSGSTRPGW
jgi:hypothetical protein